MLKTFLKNIIARIPNKNLQVKIKNCLKYIYGIIIAPVMFLRFLPLERDFKIRLNKIISFSKLYNYNSGQSYLCPPNPKADLLMAENHVMGGGPKGLS